ncbi:hypothetical protein Pmar_PMAR020608 [Perkinsus marinus ATCC 50983]|uniref:Uncharacterized protein n=1 Tax=Perkinsus marinus (strain ATCC 50983 / TXsc) TaxID=423536 RepID=C5L7I4_PERM5|nr:hypothetical protein Pmar_PMAR020608 [Perkinsus marinus ATCC 50983]EER07446.1 hypothetical protein Pmar_PMAR020608 [Perkinsus marinus ATCC 50983]|eukprot:XP_002775630.1 hypothetical protein Pmar_PMAR020608 [Perkinsus marinus ATCC 50983]
MEETPVAKEAAIKRTASQNGHTDERNSGESGSRRSYTPGCFDILFGPKGIGAEKAKDAQGHEHTREEVNRRLRWKGRAHFPSADVNAIRKAKVGSKTELRSQSMQAAPLVHFQESVSYCSFGSESPPEQVAHQCKNRTEVLVDRPHFHRLPSAQDAPKGIIASLGAHHVNASCTAVPDKPIRASSYRMSRGRSAGRSVAPKRSILKKEQLPPELDSIMLNENQLTIDSLQLGGTTKKHSPSSVSLCSTVASIYGDVYEEMDDDIRSRGASVHFRPQQVEYTFDDERLLSVSLGRTADYDGAPNEKRAEKLAEQTATKAVPRGVYAF